MKKITILLCISMILLGTGACGRGNTGTEGVSGSETADGNGGHESAENITYEETERGSDKMHTLKELVVDIIGQQNYYPDTAVETEQLEEIFGIAPEMYDEYMAEVCQDGTNVDTLLIIKAKDDKVEAVQEAMFAYREAKEKATLEDYRNIGKVKASRIETNGNFVSFVQLGGDTAAALEAGEDAVIEQCLQMNELVLEVIAQNVH